MTAQPDEPKITIEKDGPYRVEGSVPVHNAKGEVVGRQRRRFLLCRCGGSSRKPFCHASHETNGFVGTEVADRGPMAGRREAWQGDGIAIYDDRSFCAHIGNCTDNLASVFKLRQEPWIDPKGATAEAIATLIATCPSGALSYALPGAEETAEEEREPGVNPSKDGPYFVVGSIPLASEDGQSYEVRARIALCHCGGSGNKPFCDGTHWSNGFQAADGASEA
jgi:CDGSH-type Zn-finger protein